MTADTKALQTTEEEAAPPARCGILGRYPVLSVLAFAAVGIATGVGLSVWEPDDPEDKVTTVKWIGLIGDMFIRALKAVVLPLVFVNVIISMVEMMSVGRASAVGGKTIGLYLFTTLVASIIGIIAVVIMKGTFIAKDIDGSRQTRLQLGCDQEGSYLVHDMDGEVVCSANATDDMNSYFSVTDVDGMFVKKSTGPREDLSMSDTVYDGVFAKMITSNIFESFVQANFAAVVLFAICLGAALAKVMIQRGITEAESMFIHFLREVDGVFILLIEWIISITPIAVFSLISSAIGKQTDLSESFSNVGYLCLATIAGLFVQAAIVYPTLYYFTTKKNPFHYLSYVVPAQTTAFACASSAATMPVTLQCAEASGLVPASIARFVIPLGATVNMDGSAIYFPCACVWLAVLNGISPSFGDYILLAILSTIGSAGSAPVPSAGLVMVLTAYNSVFNTSGVPDGFSFIVAIDWFLDRLRTTVNVTGDAVVAACIANMVGLDLDEVIAATGNSTKHDESSEDDEGEITNA